MNTIKLFQVEGDSALYLYINENMLYRILDGLVVTAQAVPVEAEEVPFDILLITMLDNAIQNCGKIVDSALVLKMLMAIASEKAEDFD